MTTIQQARCDKGHYLPKGSVPYTLDPDCWDDTCYCEPRIKQARANKANPAVTEWVLTEANYGEVDQATDDDGLFAKNYTRSVDGKVTTVGIRIGQRPNHLVAFFGDTVTRHADGTYSVRTPEGVAR